MLARSSRRFSRSRTPRAVRAVDRCSPAPVPCSAPPHVRRHLLIRSMTGYGSADIERDGQRLNAEIRSVNHRYCEVSLRAPKMVALFEDQIRQLVQDRFSRGKMNLTITWSGAGDTGEVLKVNESVADRYVSLFKQLEGRYGINSGLDIRTLAQLPDVFSWEHTALTDEETWELVKALVEKACDNMTAM